MREYNDLSLTELSAMLRPDADAIARFLLPNGRYEGGGREWRCTGTNSPTGYPISIHVGSGPKQGVCGFWDGAQRGGDLLDAYRVIHNCGTREVADWAREWLGVGRAPGTRRNIAARRRVEIDARQKERAVQQADETRKRREVARRIWLSSFPLGGQAAIYLAKRGLNVDRAGTEIRVNPSLRHPDGGTFPALVARVCDKGGRGVGIWRIYLQASGEGKAPVDNPKLGLGDSKGCAVRIGGVWTEIGIAEGIETALACRELVHRWGGKVIPVWASLSASGMQNVILPPEVKSVRIFADNDPVKIRADGPRPSVGLTAANALAERLRSEGREVTVETPPVNKDWLDVLNALQKLEAIEAMAA